MAEYRFLRTRDGATTFAKVCVVAAASETWSIALDETVRRAAAVYRDAVVAGLKIAMEEQDKRKGHRFSVVATDLTETAADTTADAVECAAVVAAWKSFGGEEDDILLRYSDRGWKACFI